MNIQFLKFIVIAMGLLIVVGVAILGVTIVNRIAARGEAAKPPEKIALSLPDGAQIVETVLDDNRMALRLERAEGAEILIIDLTTGAVVTSVAVTKDTP